MSKVVIIGGGIIGLSAAWKLHNRGADVVVVDARSAGMTASAANAGYIGELITTGKTPDVLKPFSPARFKGLL